MPARSKADLSEPHPSAKRACWIRHPAAHLRRGRDLVLLCIRHVGDPSLRL